MKNLFLTLKIITLSVVTAFSLTACSSDDGEEDYIDLNVDGTWVQDSPGTGKIFINGDSLSLYLSGGYTPDFAGKFKATATKISINGTINFGGGVPYKLAGNYVLYDDTSPEYFVLSNFPVLSDPRVGSLTLNINGRWEKQP